MIIRAQEPKYISSEYTLAIKCPGCGNNGSFLAIGVNDIVTDYGLTVGLRKCPNNRCNAIIYYIRQDQTVVNIFPPLRIDFDSTDIPVKILQAFEETITCHSSICYTASAIMVRKTLETLCHEVGSKGGNLKEKVASLKEKVVLPNELLNGLDELRLLGNDAAHIESQLYNEIGKEEVEIAIEFTKEVLKAVFQYANLLSKLKALKKGVNE